MEMSEKTADVVIVGSGIAGLMTAHLLADHMNVIIITKSQVEASNSSKAQGGMAAALDTFDDWRKHFTDTIEAGQQHHHIAHVELMTRRAPAIVNKLEKLGVVFDRQSGGALALGMEGAHSHRRIVHANGDETGKMFITALIAKLQGRVTLYEEQFVRQLLRKDGKVIGVKTKNMTIYAGAVVLATGGAGQLYLHTSNVREATGDGFALAYRAGAALVDMEFIQFHPTLFINKQICYGLISEAVRGEGAFLVNENGKKLMQDHPARDLAARDVVSRAIFSEIQQGHHVFLNCSQIEQMEIKFPSLYKRYLKAGLETMLLPVVPGAHFMSGGIKTDQYGRTNVKGLYAVGEVACTGVHGANRLASNSLLEGLVFAEQVAEHLLTTELVTERMDNEEEEITEEDLNHPTKEQLQERMSSFVGIERHRHCLEKMEGWLSSYFPQALKVCKHDEDEVVERKNMIVTAALITTAARTRTESRGGHYRIDYSKRDDKNWLGVSILQMYRGKRELKILAPHHSVREGEKQRA